MNYLRNTAPRIAIVGSGFGGLGAAIELRKAGYQHIIASRGYIAITDF